MGERLLKYYKFVADEKGIPGKMALAGQTKMTAIKAAAEADTPEQLAIFRKAAREITGKDAPQF